MSPSWKVRRRSSLIFTSAYAAIAAASMVAIALTAVNQSPVVT
jgi:hypothetical protein